MRITDASLSEHIAFPEVGDLAEGTQADAAATDAYAPSGATHTYPERWRSPPQRTAQQFDVQLGRSDMITSVGHGPTGIDTAQPPVSVHVTRAATDACATDSRRTKPTANSKISASLRRENGDWPRGGHLRRQRDGVTDIDKSTSVGYHFLKVLHRGSRTRNTVPDWH